MTSAEEIKRNALQFVRWSSPRHGEMELLLVGYEWDFRKNRKSLVLQDRAGSVYHVPMEEVTELADKI